MLRLLILSLALFAQSAFAADPKGEEYVLQLTYQTKSESLDGNGSGSSSGSQVLAERIIAHREDGTEIEYFLPLDKDEIRGNAMWMFPARVLVSRDGTKQILNGEALQSRVDDWLELGNWSRDMCSRWLFTWTAVQIRCDNAAAIEAIETYGMRPARMEAGQTIAIAGAQAPVLLVDAGKRGDKHVLTANAAVDPEFFRKQQTEANLALAEMTGGAITTGAVKAKAARIKTTGTITVEFEVDEAGLVWKRHESAEMTVIGLEYGDEKRTMDQTITRLPSVDWEDRTAVRAPNAQ